MSTISGWDRKIKKIERLRDQSLQKANAERKSKNNAPHNPNAFVEFEEMAARYRVVVFDEVLAILNGD